MTRHLRTASLALVGTAALGAALDAPAALATTPTFYVNTTKDLEDAALGNGVCADAEGQCTLRAAVEEASAQPAGSSTTINVAAGTYKLYKGRLTIKQNTVTINGPKAATTILSGLAKHQVLTVTKGAHLTLLELTLTAGHGGGGAGGALANSGMTRVLDSVISESTAAQGGGVYNARGARLEMSNSTVTGNAAAEGVFTGPELEEGGNGGSGGGIANAGLLVISGGEVSHNSAGTGAHSIAHPAGNGGSGGGIWNGGSTANLWHVTITANDAGSGGFGNEQPSGNGGGGGGIYNAAGEVHIGDSSVVSDNASGSAGSQLNASSPAQAGNGGGIDNLATLTVREEVLFSSNVTGNGPSGGFGAGGSGGAIANGGKLYLRHSTLSANTTGLGAAGSAGGGGGALYNSGSAELLYNTLRADTTGSGGESSPGGGGAGVWNTGTLSVLGTTFAANVPGAGGNGGAREPGPGAPGGQGGSGGAILSSGTLTLTNSTVYGNGVGAGSSGGSPEGVPGAPGVGGGVLTTGGTTKLAYVTLASNVVDLTNAGGTLEANGTLIAAASGGPNCSGTITEGHGYNLDSGTSCGLGLSTDLSGVEPKLGPLAPHGHATETMAPLKGSPAIDKGGNASTGCPNEDQGHSPRPDESTDDGACDVGAYESQKLG